MNTTLTELEALYRETGNPIYVWEALLAVPLDEPLPGWIRDYLAEAAMALLVPLHDQQVPPEQALDRVPAALGLSKHGRAGNAFAAARQVELEASIAFKYACATKGRRGTAEAVVQRLAEQLGKDRSTVHRWMKNARDRWAAQKKDVAKRRPT